MIEAKSYVKNRDFAADIATQQTPFILGETGEILVVAGRHSVKKHYYYYYYYYYYY
jgi:hypothetical protein